MDMEQPATKEELLDKLRGRRRELIAGLRFHGGTANSQDLRKYSDVPKGSIHYHMQKLVQWELVEQTGSEHVGARKKAKVYELTGKGETISQEVTHTPVTTGDFAGHEERLDALEQGQAAIQDRLDRLDELEAAYENVESNLEEILARL